VQGVTANQGRETIMRSTRLRRSRSGLIGLVVASSLASLTLLSSSAGTVGQEPPVVGILSQLSLEELMDQMEPAFQRLGELGWAEGENVTYEFRVASGDQSLLPALAAELIELQPDVIFSVATAATRAATAATTEIPIVAGGAGNFVAAGWANSVERPGGNLTGVTADPAAAKLSQLELALELVPNANPVGVLLDATFARVEDDRAEFTAAAETLGVQLFMVEYDPSDGPDAAFETLHNEGVGVVALRGTAAQRELQTRQAELATQYGLPTIGGGGFVEAGGLASSGAGAGQRYVLAANFIDEILRGANPAELSLALDPRAITINLQAAQTLGVDISPELRARANLID
jgi:putative ABC transport system substrate-binding protein